MQARNIDGQGLVPETGYVDADPARHREITLADGAGHTFAAEGLKADIDLGTSVVSV